MTSGAVTDEAAVAGDPFDVALVHGLPESGLLAVFNRAGLLAPADVHAALRLARLGGERDELVVLAAALAVRGPRVGHVSVDLQAVRDAVAADADEDIDLDALPWPEPSSWLARVAASPLVAVGDGEEPELDDDRPLRLVGDALYLDRYWRDELAVAGDLRARGSAEPPAVDEATLTASLDRLFGPDPAGDQRAAAATAACRLLAVIVGGPGTGKTTTVGRLLAVLDEQAGARAERPPLVALVAPTGKAAARLEEAVHAEASRIDVAPEVRDRLMATGGSTLHRLLGSRRGMARFRYHRGLRLPHDVIVVDEASMVSLGLMARLVEAVRPDARLVLVGDPEQLVSVEAGAVLADIVGPARGASPLAGAPGTAVVPPAPAAGARATAVPGPAPADGPPMAASVAALRSNRRFAGALAALATAVRMGDADAAMAILRAADPAVAWWPEESAPPLDAVTNWASELVDAACRGRAERTLELLGRHRILCAHRHGAAGVVACNDYVARALAAGHPELAGAGAWYPGRPVLVRSNDYSLRLFNGDTGVAVAGADAGMDAAPPPSLRERGVLPPALTVVFDDGGGHPRSVAPARLADVETVYAMTVHKSQGSEFDEVGLLLPPPTSRLLTRQLLYTAVTRARQRLVVAGSEEAIRVAIGRPITRASGLTDRLWGDP